MDASFYHISEKAVERVAETAALTVPGVRSLDAKLAGLGGRSFPRVEVRLDRATATAAVEADIATTYPSPVAAITDAVRATIIAHIRALCGLDVSRVKVTVANVEADPAGGRVTWDDVASHTAGIVPTPVLVTPSEVTSPVVAERKELLPVEVESSADHLRHVVVPAPPEVEHIRTPEPPAVESVQTPEPFEPQVSGFVGPVPPLVHPAAPAPRPVRVPLPPHERSLAPILVREPEARPVRTPAPAALRPVSIPPQPRLIAPVVERPVRVERPAAPPRRPLTQIVVERPPLVPIRIEPAAPLRRVGVPQPDGVLHPVAPRPKPLKQITIQPVERYYDRTR